SLGRAQGGSILDTPGWRPHLVSIGTSSASWTFCASAVIGPRVRSEPWSPVGEERHMNECGIVLRRLVLTVVVSVVVLGCAGMTPESGGAGGGTAATAPSCGPQPAFPECKLWCWNGASLNTNQNELLGHMIIVDQNPYCIHPSSSTANVC